MPYGRRVVRRCTGEHIAYVAAACLSNEGQLHDTTYEAAVEASAKDGTAELFYLIGSYCMISVLLSACDVPLSE